MPNVIEIKTSNRLGSNRSSEKDLESHAKLTEYSHSEINVLSMVNVEFDNLHNTSASFLETQAKIVEKWNKITPCIIESQRVIIDRSTWVTKNGIPIKYTCDTMGYSMNPMGRTGVRGRGALWRWGPNHEIKVIVTRWKKYRENSKKVNSKYMYLERRRMMEFLACKCSLFAEWKLPVV